MGVGTCTLGTRVSDHLELELHRVVNYPKWMLRTSPASTRVEHVLNVLLSPLPSPFRITFLQSRQNDHFFPKGLEGESAGNLAVAPVALGLFTNSQFLESELVGSPVWLWVLHRPARITVVWA